MHEQYAVQYVSCVCQSQGSSDETIYRKVWLSQGLKPPGIRCCQAVNCTAISWQHSCCSTHLDWLVKQELWSQGCGACGSHPLAATSSFVLPSPIASSSVCRGRCFAPGSIATAGHAYLYTLMAATCTRPPDSMASSRATLSLPSYWFSSMSD